MAAMPNMQQVLAGLMSQDNNERTQAERVYNEMLNFPDNVAGELSATLASCPQVPLRSMAAVLLRRSLLNVLGGNPLWTKLSAQSRAGVKGALLQSLQNEPDQTVRKKVGDLVSELAVALLSSPPGSTAAPEGWDELLPGLFALSKQQSPQHREVALNIFADMVTLLSSTLKRYYGVMRDIFTENLRDASSLLTQLAALHALSKLISVLEEDNRDARKSFAVLVPDMLQVLSNALNAGDEDAARTGMMHFIELAESDAKFFRSNLQNVVVAFMTIAGSPQLENETRHLAFEFMLTLTEEAGGMMRKLPNFVDQLIPLVGRLLIDIDEDDSWFTEDDDEEDEVTNAAYGEEVLFRLSYYLGGKVLLPPLSKIVHAMLTSGDWKQQHGGLLAISVIGEGCKKPMRQVLGDFVQLVYPCLSHAHPRVRWAACSAVGSLAEEFCPEFQEKFHEAILPALMKIMHDAQYPRVQVHATAALINFTEDCPKEVLQPYLNTLLSELVQLLQASFVKLQEVALTAIAGIAGAAENLFEEYYNHIVPLLKQVLANATTKEYRELRGKALECVSLVAVAVGKERFAPDAEVVMQHVVQLSTSAMDDDDPQRDYLMQSSARLAQVLKLDFVPFLQYVLPPVVEMAKLEPQLSVSHADDEEEDDEGWESLVMGQTRVSMKTSVLEEKANAVTLLSCYAEFLEDGFLQFMEPVRELLVPLFQYEYNEETREAAASAMPGMIKGLVAAVKKGAAQPAAVSAFVQRVLEPFTVAVREEPDMDTLLGMLRSYHEFLDEAGDNVLLPQQLVGIGELLKVLLKDNTDRLNDRESRRRHEDYDEAEEEEISDESEKDEDVMAEIVNLIGVLFKRSRTAFVSVFENVVAPYISGWLGPQASPHYMQLALCIFCDAFEHLRGDAQRYLQIGAGAMLAGAMHANETVRQAAAYGLGQAAGVGAAFQPYLEQSLEKLRQLLAVPNARAEPHVLVTDNAISSIGRILVHHGARLGAATAGLWQLWASALPITEDEGEGVFCYGLLCEQIKANNTAVIGQGGANLPNIIRIFVGALDTKFVDDDVQAQMLELLRQMPDQAIAAAGIGEDGAKKLAAKLGRQQ